MQAKALHYIDDAFDRQTPAGPPLNCSEVPHDAYRLANVLSSDRLAADAGLGHHSRAGKIALVTEHWGPERRPSHFKPASHLD